MNINLVYDILNNSSLNSKEHNIDNAIDYLREQISILANKLDYSKYKTLVDSANNISNNSKNYVYNFHNNSVINEGIIKIYGLLAIYLKISKLLKNKKDKDEQFDIIQKIDEEIILDLNNFDSFLIKPDFIDDKLRDVNNENEDENQVYMFKNDNEGLVFDDRTIEGRNGKKDDNNDGHDKFKQKKKLYDVMTSYVNNETVFSQGKQEIIFKFQYLINGYFNNFIQRYIERYPELKDKLKFIYKGGTTMGIIFEKYNEISNDIFKNDYEKYFKRSDADYALLLQEDLGKEVYNKHYYNLVILNYNVCQKIKNFIIKNLDEILPSKLINNEGLLRKKITELDTIIKDKENSIFEEVDSVIGITVDKSTYMTEEIPDNATFVNFNTLSKYENNRENYNDDNHLEENIITDKPLSDSYRNDFYVTKDSNNHPKLISIGVKNTTPLFFYSNETNYFIRDNTITNFNLARIKYNFIVYLKLKSNTSQQPRYCALNVPAEIVDIPISKYNDFKIKKYIIKNEIKTYKNIRPDNILLYNSYTIKSFIDDIYKAIFIEPSYKPWMANKYKKKIERVLFLLQVNLGNRLTPEEFNTLQIELKKVLQNSTGQIDTQTINSEILEKILLKKFIDENNKVKFDKTSDSNEYIALIRKKLNNLTYFPFNKDNTGVDKDIEEVPYLKKYLKYKHKYLNFKKFGKK